MSCNSLSRALFRLGLSDTTQQILKPGSKPKYGFQSFSKFISSSGAKKLRVGVQGAEMFLGQRKRGVEMGPKAIRDAGLIPALQTIGHDVIDYGDIPIIEIQEEEELQVASTVGGGVRRIQQTVSASKDTGYLNIRNAKQVAEANRLISEWTAKTLQDERICVTLGGDHALGIGTVNGASQVHPDLAVLWIDAHSDINTPLTTDSGNIHGMSVSFFVKELQPYLTQIPDFASWTQPRVSARNIAFIGLRDVDPAEATILEMLGIAAFSMRDVDQYGIQKVTEMALSRISHGNKMRPIHVSYDIDSICDSVVRSTGTPVPGGLTLREGITLMEMIHDTRRLVSLDLVEVNPLLGSEDDAVTTVRAAKQIIVAALGNSRGGNALNSIPKP